MAAACGDDGSSNNGDCGDAHVTGSEQCDDGNTSNGDGCSATCRTEASSTCGNGEVNVATEQCDDGNTTAGDGCSATCQNEISMLCGNGTIDGSEACDDGNLVAGDGCSATCTVETGMGTCASPKTVTLMTMGTDLVGNGSGDTTTAMDNLPEGECDGFPSGGGRDNIWKFTTTGVRDVLVMLNDTTVFDANIRLMTMPCSITSEVVDISGDGDGCSDAGVENEPEALAYINLPAGTYYLSVDGYDDTQMGTYDFTITASMPGCGNGSLGQLEQCDDGNLTPGDGCNATCGPEMGWNCDQSEPSVCQMEGCGDGVLQLTETCDDDNTTAGDGCSPTCATETGFTCVGEPSICAPIACGNGLIEGTEECDDGNVANNDRCSATCVLEQDFTEAVEPNNTTLQALTAGSHIIRGQFAAGDVDLYTFTLATPATVEIETYSTINGDTTDYLGFGTNGLFDCLDGDDDHQLALFAAGVDTTMTALALASDNDEGDFFCSYLGLHDGPDGTGAVPTELVDLPAGTYTIRLTPDPLSTGITDRRYMLDLKITGGGGGGAVAPQAGEIKINEFLAGDGGTTTGGVDSNCDGSLVNSDDEFVELVNVTNKTLDLTGLTLSDSLAVRFTFSSSQVSGSLTLLPGKSVVVWGGGAPACAGVTNWFINGTAHTLSLNDNGDTVSLKTGAATPVTIATATYAAATIGTSLNLSPDITGTVYALHSAVTGHLGNFTPGKRVDGTPF